MQRLKQHRVIISGGGTGGHIFPAVAIAGALQEELENVEIFCLANKFLFLLVLRKKSKLCINHLYSKEKVISRNDEEREGKRQLFFVFH